MFNKKNILLNHFYQIVFQQLPGKNVQKFLHNSFWSMGGGLLAFSFLFLANILAGRWLGPEEYGKYNFILAIGNILSILLVLDIDTGITYFISKYPEKKKRIKYISSFYFLFIFLCLTIFSLLILSSFFLLNIEGVNLTILLSSLLLGLLIANKRIAEAIIRGSKKFKYQSISKITEGISVLLILVFNIFLLKQSTYKSYLVAILIGGTILILLYFHYIRKYFSLSLVYLKNIRQIFNYSRYGIINSLSTLVFKGLDKIVIITLLGTYQLGIYSAYYTISILLSARLIQLFVNVFFPSITKLVNKKKIYNKINQFLIKLSLPIFIGYIFLMRILFYFFGKDYPLHWNWLIILSFYFLFHFSANLYGWILASLHSSGYYYQNKGTILALFVFIFLIFIAYINNSFTIEWLFISLASSKLILTIFYNRIALFLLNKQE